MATFHSDGVYRIGSGVSIPRRLMTQFPDLIPEYTPEAHAARIEGEVELLMTIGEDGIPRDLRIQKSLGYGLDEKAIEFVRRWRYDPGRKDGEAVPVAANVSVHFS